MKLVLTPMDTDAAYLVAAWRYPPPYDFYNLLDALDDLVAFLCNPDHGYYQLRDTAGDLVAFCCFGKEGRVPGGDYHIPALDIGIGVRPDLTGQGQGMHYLQAVIDYAQQHFAPPALRLTVAAFNQRAIRLYQRAGFVEIQRFIPPNMGRQFIVMLRQ